MALGKIPKVKLTATEYRDKEKSICTSKGEQMLFFVANARVSSFVKRTLSALARYLRYKVAFEQNEYCTEDDKNDKEVTHCIRS